MEISPSELDDSRTTDGESNIREKNSSFSLIEEGYDIEKVMTESGAFSSIESELEIAGDDCDNSEEDLKRLASSLAPRVSALLESNEVALENLLNLTEKAWKEEEEDFEKALGQSLINEKVGFQNYPKTDGSCLFQVGSGVGLEGWSCSKAAIGNGNCSTSTGEFSVVEIHSSRGVRK